MAFWRGVVKVEDFCSCEKDQNIAIRTMEWELFTSIVVKFELHLFLDFPFASAISQVNEYFSDLNRRLVKKAFHNPFSSYNTKFSLVMACSEVQDLHIFSVGFQFEFLAGW